MADSWPNGGATESIEVVELEELDEWDRDKKGR